MSKRVIVRDFVHIYLAAGLGWIYTGLLLGLAVNAVFSPGHRILLDFNQFGELWADVAFFGFAFALMTWFLIVILPRMRRTDSESKILSKTPHDTNVTVPLSIAETTFKTTMAERPVNERCLTDNSNGPHPDFDDGGNPSVTSTIHCHAFEFHDVVLTVVADTRTQEINTILDMVCDSATSSGA